jgi:hypothetical protein
MRKLILLLAALFAVPAHAWTLTADPQNCPVTTPATTCSYLVSCDGAANVPMVPPAGPVVTLMWPIPSSLLDGKSHSCIVAEVQTVGGVATPSAPSVPFAFTLSLPVAPTNIRLINP